MKQKFAKHYRALALFFLRLTLVLWGKILLFGLKISNIDPNRDIFAEQLKEALERGGTGEGGRLEETSLADKERIDRPRANLWKKVDSERGAKQKVFEDIVEIEATKIIETSKAIKKKHAENTKKAKADFRKMERQIKEKRQIKKGKK